MSGWRSPEFRGSLRRRLNVAQANRMNKLYSDPLYLLETPSLDAGEGDAIMFSVSGSTGVPYKVSVHADGHVGCTCKDSYINARRLNCVCKHVCFVLVRAMGFTDLTFFSQARGLGLSVAEVQRCAEVARNRRSDTTDVSASTSTCDASVYSPVSLSCSSSSSSYVFTEPLRDVSDLVDADCPVCYDALIEASDEPTSNTTLHTLSSVDKGPKSLRWCPCCRNAIHTDCIRRWIVNASGSRSAPSCVMCRSTAWKEWDRS
jgi:hypothetical protein